MKTILALLLVTSASLPAAAQYYEPPPPPPPGYGPPPGYYPPPDRYPPPPPPRYRVPFGRQCEATLETPYGPRQMICPIVDPKPLGEPCACPPPPRSGYRGQYVGGRTVR